MHEVIILLFNSAIES